MAAKTKTKKKFYLGQHLRKFGAVYAFVILVVVDSLLNKNFLASTHFGIYPSRCCPSC